MRYGLCFSQNIVDNVCADTFEFGELQLAQIAELDKSSLYELRKKLTEKGISAETTNCFFPGGFRLCADGYSRNKVEEYCKLALSKARFLGIDTCVLGSGGARNIPDGSDRSSCLEQFKEAVYTAGNCAAEWGITVVIEPLNKRETNVINTVSDGAVFVRELSHPNVMLLADFYHILLENESFDSIVENADVIRHIHIARPETRAMPVPDDGYDYGSMAKAVKKAKYNGRISLEGNVKDIVNEIGVSTKYLKELFG